MLLQGNTYNLLVNITDIKDNNIKIEDVHEAEFTLGDVVKWYRHGGDVVWSKQDNAFVLPLTEEDTFSLKNNVKMQVRMLLIDGSVVGSIPMQKYVYESLSQTRFTSGGTGENKGSIIKVQMNKEFFIQGITEETDPTVPDHVKKITSEDIEKWNNIPTNTSQLINDGDGISKFATEDFVANNGGKIQSISVDGVKQEVDENKNVNLVFDGYVKKDYVDTKIADLVNSAPEALDTLGELATAFKENEDVVDALNSAIGSKASTEYVDEKYRALQSQIGNAEGIANINEIDSIFETEIITLLDGNLLIEKTGANITQDGTNITIGG